MQVRFPGAKVILTFRIMRYIMAGARKGFMKKMHKGSIGASLTRTYVKSL